MVKLAGNVSPLARNLVEVSITFASGCALPCRRILHAVPGMRSQPRGDRRSVQDPFQPPPLRGVRSGFSKKKSADFFSPKIGHSEKGRWNLQSLGVTAVHAQPHGRHGGETPGRRGVRGPHE